MMHLPIPKLHVYTQAKTYVDTVAIVQKKNCAGLTLKGPVVVLAAIGVKRCKKEL